MNAFNYRCGIWKRYNKVKGIRLHTLLTVFVLLLIVGGCSRLGRLSKSQPRADLELPRQQRLQPTGISDSVTTQSTKPIVYTRSDGDTVYFVPTTRDTVTGEQMMSMQIEKVTITASSQRNVVERMGKINLEFVVTVPDSLLASDWAIQLHPTMLKGPDSIPLSDLGYYGERFRRMQQRQYARYERYLRRIVDSADFFTAFGNFAAFERYLRDAGAELQRLRALKQHADTLDAERAVRDSLIWTYDKDEYGISLRELNRYNRRVDRLIRRKTLYFQDKRDPYDHLSDYLAPRYKYTERDTILVGGQFCYTRLVQDQDEARKRDLGRQRVYDSLTYARKDRDDYSLRWQRSLYEARRRYSTLQRLHITGISTGRERDILRLLSDSAKTKRFEIKKGEIDGSIRLLTSLDTVELMRRYLNESKVARNERLRAGIGDAYSRMVRFPYIPDLRLDTVVRADNSVSYYYTQEVPADEYTSKLSIWLDGEVIDVHGKQYTMPRSEPLTFNIVSMLSFVDTLPRYVQRVVTRNAEVNAQFNFLFPKSKTRLDERLGDNYRQLQQVKQLTRALMTDPVFIIDSITLLATSSPEGNWSVNDRLARERAAELKRVVDAEFRALYDSLHIAAGYTVDEKGVTRRVEVQNDLPDLPNLLHAEHLAEDWTRLSRLILQDTEMPDKEAVLEMIASESNPDRRELLIRRKYPRAYVYMREKLYPQLRAVDFRFNLHRRGMLQDTVYTTELDTTYLRGRRLLEKRRYEEALQVLRSYEDHNTALAYMSVGYDKAALRIFSQAGETPDTKYLMAILCSRMGDEQAAVQHFLRAVEMNPKLRFRGNLDPEIARLVKKYTLFPEDDR